MAHADILSSSWYSVGQANRARARARSLSLTEAQSTRRFFDSIERAAPGLVRVTSGPRTFYLDLVIKLGHIGYIGWLTPTSEGL